MPGRGVKPGVGAGGRAGGAGVPGSGWLRQSLDAGSDRRTHRGADVRGEGWPRSILRAEP